MIAVIGPFPPPLGGASKNTQILAHRLSLVSSICEVKTSADNLAHGRSLVGHIRRLIIIIKGAARLLMYGRRLTVAYIVPDGGFGLFYSCLLLAAARCFVRTVFVHYRNYSYISQKFPLMVAFQKLLPRDRVHIFLSKKMKSEFEDAYGSNGVARICSNAAFVNPAHDDSRTFNEKMTVGFLSNICAEKGFELFAELVDRYNAEYGDGSVHFHVAGAPVAANDSEKLNSWLANAENVQYWGPVYGQRKTQFLSQLDVLVFPTLFRQECQPNVIFEAMAAGVMPMAISIGCIPDMYGELEGWQYRNAKEFKSRAAGAIAELASSRELLEQMKSRALRHMEVQHHVAKEAFECLIAELTAGTSSKVIRNEASR